MKQRVLAVAIKRMIWAELALSAALAVPALAQSQPATTGTTPPAEATGGAAASVPATGAAQSGTAGTTGKAATTGTAATAGTVKQLQTFQVTGSLIRSSDKVGYNQVQTVSQKDIQDSGANSVAPIGTASLTNPRRTYLRLSRTGMSDNGSLSIGL